MEYLEAILILAGVNMIAAVGLAILTGFTGLFSLGHGAFMAIGAYVSAILTHYYHVPFPIALLAAIFATTVASFMIGYPTLRAKLRTDYFAIATMGFGEAVRVILENLEITHGARGLPGVPLYTNVPITLALTVFGVWISHNFLSSTYGRKVRAIGQDVVAAEMMGINILNNELLSLAISAAFAGMAGTLYAHYLMYIQPVMFAAVLSTQLLAAVICGGMGGLTGPMIAAFLFIAIPEALRVAQLWRLVAYGALIVLIMVIRPEGLFGYREITLETFRPLVAKIPFLRNKLDARKRKISSLVAGKQEGEAFKVAAAPSMKVGGLPRTQGEAEAIHPLLQVSGLNRAFGGVIAVDNLSFSMSPGEIMGMIGPNGSGKTTVFNLIEGVYPVDSGTIIFDGQNLVGKPPDEIATLGISRTFQNIRLFPRMSVLGNVQAALHPLGKYDLAQAFLRTKAVMQNEEEILEAAISLLRLVGLEELWERAASTLPYGPQRQLEIARALALRPELLLLDEPTAGMNPEESFGVVELIHMLHEDLGLAIILVEHHMEVVMNLCPRIIVLNFGAKIAEGTPEEIQSNPEVIKAYLGGG